MKTKFYIVEEHWYDETFSYFFADKDAAIVAQLLLEPDVSVQEIEVDDAKRIKELQQSVKHTCKELKDVFHRTDYNGTTVDIPILSTDYCVKVLAYN